MRYLAAAIGAVLFITALGAQGSKPVRTVEDCVLDKIVLYTETAPAATSAVVIRPFSASDADLVFDDKDRKELPKETKEMQDRAPKLLGERFAARLKQLGPYKEVSVVESGNGPAGAAVMEGKFTSLDPGNRALRYSVGFGAGKSSVAVAGSVKAADGTLLATFEQRRIGSMGMFGGNSLNKLIDDSKSIGEDLAEFLNKWANKKKLD